MSSDSGLVTFPTLSPGSGTGMGGVCHLPTQLDSCRELEQKAGFLQPGLQRREGKAELKLPPDDSKVQGGLCPPEMSALLMPRV